MIFPKYYIGPMSVNVVDCVIEHGQKRHIGLIPSRRQIDFCGGYVNGWNTQTFSTFVKSRNSRILLCRDHGGENQGQEQDNGEESFATDLKYLDLIHIDPFKSIKTMEQAANKTVSIIDKLFEFNENMIYEVGTEQEIFKYEPEQLNWFLAHLKEKLGSIKFNQIKYAVVQSGVKLDLTTRTNTGNYDNKRLVNFIEVVKKYNLLSKEHNGDYLLDSFDVESRFQDGLDAINIAPEFGQVESEYYLEQCKEDPKLFDILYEICYNSYKWKKWIEDLNSVSKEQLIMTCCHYVLSDIKFLEQIKSNFPDADKKIKERISSKLNLLYEQTKNYSF